MLNRSRCSTSCATGTAPGGNYSCKHGSLNGSCRKRPPQRGLGVAQLEKMRLQEEERIMISQQKIMLHSTAMAARQHQLQQQYYQQVKPQLQPPDQPNQLQQDFSSNIPMIPHHDHDRNHQQQLLHRSARSQHPVLPPLHIFFPNKLSIDHCTNSTVLHNHSTHRQDDISVSPPVNQVDHAVLDSTPNHDRIMINHPVPFPSYYPDWPPANAKYNSPLPNSTISFSHQAVSQPQQQTQQQQQLQNMTTNVPSPRSVTEQQLDLNPSSSNWSICPQQSLPIADHRSWSSKPTACTDTAAAADEIRLWPPAMLSMIPLQKRVYQYQLQKDSPCPMGQLYSPPSCLGAALMELPSLQNSGCHEQQTMCSAWLPAVSGLEAADRDWSARLSMDLNAAASDQFIEAEAATLWKEGCTSLLMAPPPVLLSPQSTSSSNISSCKTAMEGSLLSLSQYSPDHSSTVSSLYDNKHIRSSDISCSGKKTGCHDDFLKLGPPISDETCTGFNLTMEHKQHDIQQPVTCGHKVDCQEQPCETSCHGRLKVTMIKRTPKDDLLTGSEPTIVDLELRLSLPRFIG